MTGEETAELMLSTMSEEEVSECQITTALIARAFNDNIDAAISEAYTRRSISINQNDIPLNDTARKLPHLAS